MTHGRGGSFGHSRNSDVFVRKKARSWPDMQWNQFCRWVRFQYLEIFDRSELAWARLENESSRMENEYGHARRRLQEAIVLRDSLASRFRESDDRVACAEKDASDALVNGDEALTRKILADKLVWMERRDAISTEYEQTQELVALAESKLREIEVPASEYRHHFALVAHRRDRSSLEASILGVIPVSQRRTAERMLACLKLVGFLLLLLGVNWVARSAWRSCEQIVLLYLR